MPRSSPADWNGAVGGAVKDLRREAQPLQVGIAAGARAAANREAS
jgi:hypothetical protein